MWWLLQIIACLAVTAKNALYSRVGFSLYVLLLIPVIELAFWKSFSKAPSFFRVWFLGYACLAIMGFCVSLLFGEVATPKHYVGACLALVSGYLLVT